MRLPSALSKQNCHYHHYISSLRVILHIGCYLAPQVRRLLKAVHGKYHHSNLTVISISLLKTIQLVVNKATTRQQQGIRLKCRQDHGSPFYEISHVQNVHNSIYRLVTRNRQHEHMTAVMDSLR